MFRAVERFWKRIAELVFCFAAVLAPAFLYESDWRDAGISAGIAVACYVYCTAVDELTPRG